MPKHAAGKQSRWNIQAKTGAKKLAKLRSRKKITKRVDAGYGAGNQMENVIKPYGNNYGVRLHLTCGG